MARPPGPKRSRFFSLASDYALASSQVKGIVRCAAEFPFIVVTQRSCGTKVGVGCTNSVRPTESAACRESQVLVPQATERLTHRQPVGLTPRSGSSRSRPTLPTQA